MRLCRLVVLHAHGSESSELAAMNHIGVQHEDVLRHADKSSLHLIHVRLDLVRLVQLGQVGRTQVQSRHGEPAKRAVLIVGERLQAFVDCLLLGEALERFGRLVVGRLRAEINQVVKRKLSEVGLEVLRWAERRKD